MRQRSHRSVVLRGVSTSARGVHPSSPESAPLSKTTLEVRLMQGKQEELDFLRRCLCEVNALGYSYLVHASTQPLVLLPFENTNSPFLCRIRSNSPRAIGGLWWNRCCSERMLLRTSSTRFFRWRYRRKVPIQPRGLSSAERSDSGF